MHVVGLGAAEDRETLMKRLMNCLTIGQTNSFEQDPIHGIEAMTEVAQRALSPAVNDPGTARDVIQRQLRLLTRTGPVATDHEARRPLLHVREISAADMVRAAFAPLARDAGGMFEVQSALIDALHALTKLKPEYYGTAAAEIVELVAYHAERSGMQPLQLDTLSKKMVHIRNRKLHTAL